MKKYFYSDGNEKHGPLSLDELKQEKITNDTLIWFEGLDDWTKAKYVLELELKEVCYYFKHSSCFRTRGARFFPLVRCFFSTWSLFDVFSCLINHMAPLLCPCLLPTYCLAPSTQF